MCALSGMGVTIFLGGWQAPLPFLEIIPSYVWFTVKLLTLLLAFIWIRATFPRLRIDQLTRFAWKFLVPLALIDLGVAALTAAGPWRQRAFAVTAVASAAWIAGGVLWWRRGWTNLWGPRPTAALPLASAASSAVILYKFASARRPT